MTMRRTRGGDGRRHGRLASGGATLLLAVIVSGLGLAPAAARAADGDAAGDAPGADAPAPADDGGPLPIEGAALYVSPVTDAVPSMLTTSVPPAMVCVLQPDLCPERPDGYPEFLPWREDIPALFGAIQDEARDLPVQPVPPDTAAVSFLGGVTRYQTALLFDTPEVPDGEEVVRYEVSFPQAQPSYDVSSPLFRRAILAVFETLATQDPAVFAEGLAEAIGESPIDTSPVLSFEACPLLAPFEPAGAPLAADDGELPQHEDDGDTVTAVDCTFGGNGVYDADADVWRVDLAFAAQAWASGELDNHGVLLRPIGAPNLAFGDADTSTNAQLVLDIADVTAALETMEAFDPDDVADLGDVAAPLPTDPDLDGDLDDGSVDAGNDLGGGGDPFGAPLDAPAFPTGDETVFDEAAPAVADDLVAAPDTVGGQAARPAAAVPSTPWWVWLSVPLLLVGAYLTGSSVLAPAAVTGRPDDQGALSRLLAKHAATASSPTQI